MERDRRRAGKPGKRGRMTHIYKRKISQAHQVAVPNPNPKKRQKRDENENKKS
jgi:hypothetical protein